VPLAAELAAASANFLFGEEPSVFAEDVSAQKRLDEALSACGFAAALYSCAELASAYGDAYLKINWDKALLDSPAVAHVPADCVYMEEVCGVPAAYHFLASEETPGGGRLWTYELYGRGFIKTEIYEGSPESLGRLAGEATAATGVDAPLAAHFPNVLPDPADPAGVFGRSDLFGLTDMLDALDEAYSSWVRDMSLAKARLIVPMEYMRIKQSAFGNDDRKIYHFDRDDDLYVAMDIDTSEASSPITLSQFAIRSEEHAKLCRELIERIVSAAGYSPQSFGLEVSGWAESGAALAIRERKTFATKAKKELCFKARLRRFISLFMRADEAVFGHKYRSFGASVEIKGNSAYLSGIAATVEALSRAGAASTYTKVQIAHPDWSDAAILEEVEKIKAEKIFAKGESGNGLGLELGL
jgi:hypothetical protein